MVAREPPNSKGFRVLRQDLAASADLGHGTHLRAVESQVVVTRAPGRPGR